MEKLIQEAEKLIQDINMLQWEMDGALRAHYKLSNMERTNLEKSLRQLNEDEKVINKLLTELKNTRI